MLQGKNHTANIIYDDVVEFVDPVLLRDQKDAKTNRR